MSGLFGQLSSSMNALTAASRSIETTGRNLANVSNPDYARQRVIYGSRGTVMTELGAQSLGIEAVGVEQLRDSLLDQQVVRESSKLASYTSEQSAYQKAEAALGQSIDQSSEKGATGGLSEALSNFFNGFQSFAANPTDVGERQTLLQYAGVLTDAFNETDSRLAQVQTDLTTQIQSDVTDANTLLSQIAELNAQIGRFEINAPGTAVDLRDERQAKIEELGKKMSIETQPDPAGSGQLQVYARDSGGALVQLVNLTAVTGPVTFSGSTISAGSPSTALALSGGSIDGALTARDGVLQTLRGNLNSFANQLVTSVNAAYNPLGTTGDFFQSSGVTASTIALDSTLTATNLKASDGGAAADNTIALAVANLASHVFSTSGSDSIDGTFSRFYTNTVALLGQSLSTTNDHVTNQTTIDTIVRNQRDSVSGVSMDEEMTDLIRYQRAFQASSRVVSIIDELLDTVVNKLG
jgi:flagellar hook-associated protein 1 FlgK